MISLREREAAHMPTNIQPTHPVRKHRRRRRSPLRSLLPIVLVILALIAAALLHTRSSQSYPWSLRHSRLIAPEIQTPPELPDWVTQELLPVNQYSRPGTPLEQVNGIVVHYVGNPGTTAQNNRDYFASLAETGETSASSHFVIGLDGEIIQCVPLDEIAYCSNDRNSDTISIECCHPDQDGKFTDATYASLVRLTAYLADYYHLNEDQIIRHYDVTGKECPLYFVRHEDAWLQFRQDVASYSGTD